MTEEIARLGIAVDSRDAKKGARELDSLTGAGRRAEQQTQRLADSSKRTNQSIAGQPSVQSGKKSPLKSRLSE